MGRLKPFDLITLTVISVGGIYMGIQFFQPIVVDQLRKDGNLRKDIEIPEFEQIQDDSKGVSELRAKLIRIHEKELQEVDQKGPKSSGF